MSIDDEEPPCVLILAGVSTGLASGMLTYLWDLSVPPNKRKASYIRLVDKFLIIPQGDVFLRWVDPGARKVLKEGFGKGVEYVQGNLTSPELRQRIFTPPPGLKKKTWDIVIDNYVAEANIAVSEQAQIDMIARTASFLGREAIKNGGVGAYVRCVNPFVTQPKNRCPLREDDTEARPTATWAKWSIEGARALAAIPKLRLVCARMANPWGPGCLIGLTRRMTIASIYKYLGPGNTMEFLWGKDLVLEHIHTYDLADAFFTLAQWMRKVARTRARANELAGSPMPPCRPGVIPPDEQGDPTHAFAYDHMEIPDLVPREQTVYAPFFNVTDGSGMTQGEVGDVLSKVMGIRVDYHSALTNALAKMNMSEVVEIAAEKHVEPWYEMLALNDPPIQNTPLSPALPDTILRKSRCHLDLSKMRQIVGWQPKFPRITEEEVKRTWEIFIEDGVWPVVPVRNPLMWQ